jgi:hypothetical protein
LETALAEKRECYKREKEKRKTIIESAEKGSAT